MEQNPIQRLRKSLNKGKPGRKEKLKVFLICLGISALIWIFVSLSQRSITTVDYKVVIQNIPENFVPAASNSEYVSARIEHLGFSLLRLTSGKTPTVILDLKDEGYTQAEDHIQFKLQGNLLRNRIEEGISGEGKVIEIFEEQLELRFDLHVGKRIPVTVDLSDIPKKIEIHDINIIPDSIEISGPMQLVDTIDQIRVAGENIRITEKSQKIELPESDAFSLSKEDVRIQLSYTVLTDHTEALPIAVHNTPENFDLKIVPESAKIHFYTPEDLADFQLPYIYVNFDGNTPKNRLRIHVDSLDEQLRHVSVSPEQVDFILSKNE